MKKRIKKKIKKLKKSINKINKVRVQKGRKAMLQETWATVTYGLYDNRKIRRLKKFPPALVENRMLFETNDDFTDNGRALFDYLIEKGYNKKYEIVWLVHEPSKYKEYQFENVKFVQNFKKGSTIRRAEAYKYALTSKYIFYTQAFNWIGMSRRNQLFIDLWPVSYTHLRRFSSFKRSCSVTADLSPLLPSCRQNRKISGGSVRADNRTACCYCGML